MENIILQVSKNLDINLKINWIINTIMQSMILKYDAGKSFDILIINFTST